MRSFAPYLDALVGQSRVMGDLVNRWVGIRSGSHEVEGLARMAEELKAAFAGLGGEIEELALPTQRTIDADGHPQESHLGKALRIRKRPGAPLQVFLGIHYDVVYGDSGSGGGTAAKKASVPVWREPAPTGQPGEDPIPAGREAFPTSTSTSTPAEADPARPGVTSGEPPAREILRGSGGADAKGGIVILLKALEALESSPHAAGLGWEVLLNPDEEIGSPGSLPLLREAAGRNHLGLLFEPCLPDGSLVSARKGSGNFTAVMRGRAAHAGRDPHLGRNAVSALAELIVELDRFGRSQSGISVNVGKVEGGGPVNRVPDLALGRFNLRVRSEADQAEAEAYLAKAVEEFNRRDGFSLEIHGSFQSPPKLPAGPALGLQAMVAACGKELGIPIKWEESGGVSDGNKLAAAGLPNIDTLGPRGGNIHSDEEFLDLDSLAERARLAALLLFKLATGEMSWPPPAVPEAKPAAAGSNRGGTRASRMAAAAAAAAAEAARATAGDDKAVPRTAGTEALPAPERGEQAAGEAGAAGEKPKKPLSGGPRKGTRQEGNI